MQSECGGVRECAKVFGRVEVGCLKTKPEMELLLEMEGERVT